MVNDGSRLFIVFFFFWLIQRQTIVTKIKQYFAFFLFNHEKYGVLEMHRLNTIFFSNRCSDDYYNGQFYTLHIWRLTSLRTVFATNLANRRKRIFFSWKFIFLATILNLYQNAIRLQYDCLCLALVDLQLPTTAWDHFESDASSHIALSCDFC